MTHGELPREVIEAGVRAYLAISGIAKPEVVAKRIAEVVAQHLEEKGVLEVRVTAAAPPEPVPPSTLRTPDREFFTASSTTGLQRIGATPLEVGYVVDGRIDHCDPKYSNSTLPAGPDFMRSLQLPFGRPQPLLKDVQARIDRMVAGHRRMT